MHQNFYSGVRLCQDKRLLWEPNTNLMKQYTFLLLTLLYFTLNSNANNLIYSHPTKDTIPVIDTSSQFLTGEHVYDKVEVEAEFPGGVAAWTDFLKANLNPDLKSFRKAKPGLYTVIAQFIVDKEGNLSNIKALTNPGYGLEKEVIRVLNKSQKWLPAVQNGRKVKAYRKQPGTFKSST